jgi:hypothetical protein
MPGQEDKPAMTQEQEASISKAVGQANVSQEISGASEVTAKPAPNDPTPVDKARDIGQDLQKQGVTLDRE